MKLLIGIDGGGTKTNCILTNENFDVLHQCLGGPSNFLLLGTETVSETIFKLINECIASTRTNFDDIASVVIGTAGAGRRADAQKLENECLRYIRYKGYDIKNFHVESDARITLEGAFSGKPGSILIAGTGSIMFGKDAKRIIYRVGGFGRYLGDEGGGYSIGRKGLNAVSKEFDGRGPKTLITQLVKEKFNISSPEALIYEVYRKNFDIASAAPVVISAAGMDDIAALKIIEEETDELILHITTMIKKINEPVLFISLSGSILTNDNFFTKMLMKKIAQYPNVQLKEPEYDPAMGAVLIAKQLINNGGK